MSVQSDLDHSMNEEMSASVDYRGRAENARARGDEVSAKLWIHIAEEEDGHYNEFKDRLGALMPKPRFADYATPGDEYQAPEAPSRSHEFEPVMLGNQHGWRCGVCGYEEISAFFGKTPPCKGLPKTRPADYTTPGDIKYHPQGALRRFPQTDADWEDLGYDIEAKLPPGSFTGRAEVRHRVAVATSRSREEGDVDEAKRWLVKKASELDIR